jgi:electron transfer flavoprotein beta subunit
VEWLKIICLIKQVPDTTDIKINPETNTLIRDGVPSIINPFDMYAIEEGLRIKEKLGGEVIAISMGPPQAEEALREALSLGVDEALLLSHPSFAGADTWATSYTLAQAIRKLSPYDLILCGRQASDGDTGQVGPGVAEQLNIPQVAFVRRIEEIGPEMAVAQRMTEEGYEVIQSPLPALLSVVKEINEPRLPSLRGKLRAKGAEIPIWGVDELGVKKEDVGLDGSPTKVLRIFNPPAREKGEIWEGDPDEVADRLFNKLRDCHLL